MNKVDVLICTALLDELEGVLRVYDEPEESWEESRLPDGFRYRHATFRGNDLRVAAVWVGAFGAEDAAARLRKLMAHLAPRALAVCGVCAGRPGAVALGDVIVADRVYRYDLDTPDAGRSLEAYALPANWAMEARYLARRFDEEGKWMRRRPRSMGSQRSWLLRTLDAHIERGEPAPSAHPDRKYRCPDWADVVRTLQGERHVELANGALSLTDEGRALVRNEQLLFVDGPPEDPPIVVRFGALATGPSLVTSPDVFDRLRAIDQKTIALDMETGAFLEVAHQSSVPTLVVKAISDFAGNQREPRFRPFASAVAAQFAIELLHRIPITETVTTTPAAPPHQLAAPWSKLLPALQKVLAALAACAHQTTVSTVAWVVEMDEPLVESSLATLVQQGLANLTPAAERPWSISLAIRDFVRTQPIGKLAVQRHADYTDVAIARHTDQTRWREFDQDVPEVMAAVDDEEHAGRHLEAYRRLARICEYELRRGRFRELAQRLDRLVPYLPASSEQRADALIHISRCHCSLGETRLALTEAQDAIVIAEKNRLDLHYARALAEVGRNQLIHGEKDVGLSNSEEALRRAEPHGAVALQVELLATIASRHLSNGDVVTARKLYFQGFTLAQMGNDSTLFGAPMIGVGMCALVEEYSNAEPHFRSALESEERVGNVASGAIAQICVALSLFGREEERASALKLAQEANSTSERIGFASGHAFCQGYLGVIHLVLGDGRIAFEHWRRAFEILEKIGYSSEHPDIARVMTILTGRGTFVTDVHIQRVRSIDELHWGIPLGREPGWHVVIGDNGAGKSSFLRSLALALVSNGDAHALRQDWGDWLRRGSPEGGIGVTLSRHIFVPTRVSMTFGVALRFSEHADQVKLEDASANDLNEFIRDGSIPGLFSAAYGPFRRFSGGDSDYEKLFASLPRLARHLSLFDERPALTESIAWLKLLHHKQLEKEPEGDILDAIKTFVNQADFLPHGSRLTKVSSSVVLFTDGNGCEVGIEQLSDGHRSILSLTLELLRQLVVTYGPKKIFDLEDPTKVIAPGVVLIDEIDVHLHPTWQRSVGIWFTKHFPNIQFIVTSHSPLVCQAAEIGTVFLLPKPGTTGGRMLEGAELDRLRYGNVLDAYGTGVFGQDVVRSESGKQKLERLAELNDAELERDLTAEENVERARLRAMFPTTAHALSGMGG